MDRNADRYFAEPAAGIVMLAFEHSPSKHVPKYGPNGDIPEHVSPLGRFVYAQKLFAHVASEHVST
jgi:hypothetical protein